MKFLQRVVLLFCAGMFATTLDPQLVRAEEKPLSFAVIPFYSPDKIWTLYTPFVEYLKKTTGRPWELKLYHDHAKFVEDVCNGSISLALAGPVPLGRANAACGARPLLVARGKDGTPYYRSVLVTSSPALTSLAGLRGKRVAYFKGSTAAHIVPFAMLRDVGITLKDIKAVSLESQDSILNALLAGDVDGAGIKESLYRRMEKTSLKVLATSPSLPNFALSAGTRLPAAVSKKVVTELLALAPAKNTGHATLMNSWDDELKNGFVLPDQHFMSSVLKLKQLYDSTPQ